MKVIVTAPNPNFTGKRHGYEFKNGVAEIEEAKIGNVGISKFKKDRYKVELPKKTKSK